MRLRVLSVIAIIGMFALSSVAQTPATPAPAAKPFANPANLKEKAPEVYKANFDTSAGLIVIEVHRAWSPNGADRFYNLVKSGFFDEIRFYRIVPDFMAQFGIHGEPAVNQAWSRSQIQDDPMKESNRKYYVTFAKTGAPNSRNTQLFINLKDNAFLDPQGFSPIGKVITGMNVVDKLYTGYGEMAEQGGRGVSQQQFTMQGNAYLMKSFPKLDYIKKATIAQ